MARTVTTDAADARKLSSEDEEAFLNDFADNIRTGTIDFTPDDNFTSEDSPSTPTFVRAERRKSAIGSISKTIGGDVVGQPFSSLAGDWLAGEAETQLGMDGKTDTPTAAVS